MTTSALPYASYEHMLTDYELAIEYVLAENGQVPTRPIAFAGGDFYDGLARDLEAGTPAGWTLEYDRQIIQSGPAGGKVGFCVTAPISARDGAKPHGYQVIVIQREAGPLIFIAAGWLALRLAGKSVDEVF